MCNHQYCIDYQKIYNHFIHVDDYDFNLFQKFNTKYQETLHLIIEYNYLKLKIVNTEKKIIQLLSIAKKISKKLHPLLYTICEEEDLN